LCESNGIRAIQRLTGLHQETILNILETAGQKAAAWASYCNEVGAVARVFGGEVDYATETKYYAKPAYYLPRRVISLNRKSRIGSPDMTKATTCHCERTNLSVRLFNRRFTRCTLGYSKKLENLKYAVALFVWHFNFCRIHSAHKQTPAQAAKIAENPMTIEELLNSAN